MTPEQQRSKRTIDRMALVFLGDGPGGRRAGAAGDSAIIGSEVST